MFACAWPTNLHGRQFNPSLVSTFVSCFSEHISACFYFKWAVPADRRLCDSDDMGVGTYITLDTRSKPTTNAFICNISTRFLSEALSCRGGSFTALKLDVSQCLKSYCGHDSTMNLCLCSISFITWMRLSSLETWRHYERHGLTKCGVWDRSATRNGPKWPVIVVLMADKHKWICNARPPTTEYNKTEPDPIKIKTGN